MLDYYIMQLFSLTCLHKDEASSNSQVSNVNEQWQNVLLCGTRHPRLQLFPNRIYDEKFRGPRGTLCSPLLLVCIDRHHLRADTSEKREKVRRKLPYV